MTAENVNRAVGVIPAAGRGTRFRPASRWGSKEMFPVGRKPAIQWVLEEAAVSGLRRVVVVVAPEKTDLQNFLTDLDRIEGPVGKLQVQQAVQQTPEGLADALRIGWDRVDREPDGVFSLLPDNLYLGDGQPNSVEWLVEQVDTSADSFHLLQRLAPEDLNEYGYEGVPELQALDEHRYQLTSLPGKQSSQEHEEKATGGQEEVIRGAGRTWFGRSFFDILDEIEGDLQSQGRELDDVLVVREMIERGKRVEGKIFPGRLWDVGHVSGMAAAWQEMI